jgi:GDPmannose 4,6-dehydratase
MGTLHLLEAFREHAPEARFYQASSSEMFGDAPAPQNEHTPLRPLSPYACAKAHAHMLARHYRDAYGLWIARGVLFNHESERRGETFVTRKITRAAGRIRCGLQDKLELGDIKPLRDWGHAEDYVRAMWQMLQYPEPEDFVVGSGKAMSVEVFLCAVFERLGLDVHDHVEIETPKYMRPGDPYVLRADAAKVRRILAWRPEICFDELVARMTDHDLKLAEREAAHG